MDVLAGNKPDVFKGWKAGQCGSAQKPRGRC